MRGWPLVLTFVLSCGTGADSAAPIPGGPFVERLSPTERLVRTSMVLRGIRPTVDELEAVQTDPDRLEGYVDAWLESDAFGTTVRDLHAELFLLRRDTTDQLPVKGILAERGYDQDDLYRSTTEAPLRMVEAIVREDRPYTEILTADPAPLNVGGPLGRAFRLDRQAAVRLWDGIDWRVETARYNLRDGIAFTLDGDDLRAGEYWSFCPWCGRARGPT